MNKYLEKVAADPVRLAEALTNKHDSVRKGLTQLGTLAGKKHKAGMFVMPTEPKGRAAAKSFSSLRRNLGKMGLSKDERAAFDNAVLKQLKTK